MKAKGIGAELVGSFTVETGDQDEAGTSCQPSDPGDGGGGCER